MTMEIDRVVIAEAADRLAPYVRRTPVLEVAAPDFGVRGRLLFKMEMLQRSGTFKVRGAFNLVLEHLEGDRAAEPLVAASGGNFAFALGYAASALGAHAHLFVPSTSPAAKVENVRSTGAEITIIDGFYADALEASRAYVAENGGRLAHAYDQVPVVVGAGTCGLEIDEQILDVDTVLVPVGGGGLIAGIAFALQDDAAVVGVETEKTPTLYEARRRGGPVDVEVGGVAVSSLGSKRLGDIAWEASQRWIDDALLVTDDAVVEAQRTIWSKARIMVEPGGAVGVAALISGAYRPRDDEVVVVVLSGANLDPVSIFN
jgi:threonine dehydratase